MEIKTYHLMRQDLFNIIKEYDKCTGKNRFQKYNFVQFDRMFNVIAWYFYTIDFKSKRFYGEFFVDYISEEEQKVYKKYITPIINHYCRKKTKKIQSTEIGMIFYIRLLYFFYENQIDKKSIYCYEDFYKLENWYIIHEMLTLNNIADSFKKEKSMACYILQKSDNIVCHIKNYRENYIKKEQEKEMNKRNISPTNQKKYDAKKWDSINDEIQKKFENEYNTDFNILVSIIMKLLQMRFSFSFVMVEDKTSKKFFEIKKDYAESLKASFDAIYETAIELTNRTLRENNYFFQIEVIKEVLDAFIPPMQTYNNALNGTIMHLHNMEKGGYGKYFNEVKSLIHWFDKNKMNQLFEKNKFIIKDKKIIMTDEGV